MRTERGLVAAGAVLGLLGVGAGAFGAHALRGSVTPRDLEIFETAVRYQLIHAVALLAVAAAWERWPHARGLLAGAGTAMVAGVVVFSGSLYALVGTGVRALGAVTPLGGVAFLAGWGLVALAALRSPPED